MQTTPTQLSKLYPSDITSEQFKRIRPMLEAARAKTKPLEVDLYQVFNAILYVLREGCRWRSLPRDYPKWQSVYYHFRHWRDGVDKASGQPLLEQVLKKLVAAERTANEREEKTTYLIIDAQSVKNTDPAETKGYDAGKKASGIKRHLAVDTQGFPHVLHVTTADISDKAGAKEMLLACAKRLAKVKGILVDGGYSGQPFADFVCEHLAATVEVAKRNELHTFKVIPNRWVVERSISWLEKCRRLWKNCERKLTTSLAMMRLAFISLILRRS